MNKTIGNGLLAFGLGFFMSHVLRILGGTMLETFVYSVIPSIAITIGIWSLTRGDGQN